MLNWVWYGDCSVWKKFIAGSSLLLILMGYLICKPVFDFYIEVKNQVIYQHELLAKYQKEMNSLPLNLKEIPTLSLKESAGRYELAYHFEHRKAYFAGTTDNCLKLLHALFLASYPMKGFDLTQTEHKTLLAIEL